MRWMLLRAVRDLLSKWLIPDFHSKIFNTTSTFELKYTMLEKSQFILLLPSIESRLSGLIKFSSWRSVTLSLFFFEQPLAFPAGVRREVSKDRCKSGFQDSRENK
jgi:hypothetical protein